MPGSLILFAVLAAAAIPCIADEHPDRRDRAHQERLNEHEEALTDQLQHLRRELRRLTSDFGPDHPETTEIRRKIESTEHRSHRAAREHHEHSTHERRPQDDAHRRMEALREAAERLHGGGVHEFAERLQQEANEIERHLDQQHHHREGNAVDSLREEIRELRGQIHGIHEKLDRVLELLRRRRNGSSEEEHSEESAARPNKRRLMAPASAPDFVKFMQWDSPPRGSLAELREKEKTWVLRPGPVDIRNGQIRPFLQIEGPKKN